MTERGTADSYLIEVFVGEVDLERNLFDDKGYDTDFQVISTRF
jgi:hypothetical protein